MIESIYDRCKKITEEVEQEYSLMVILVPAGKPISALESIIVATYQTPEEGAAGLHSMVENVKPEDLLTEPREEEIAEPRPGAPIQKPQPEDDELDDEPAPVDVEVEGSRDEYLDGIMKRRTSRKGPGREGPGSKALSREVD